jgi:hypothetical protein
MSELTTKRRTLCEEIVHEAFRIVEAIQWHKGQPRMAEIYTVGVCLWKITAKLTTLRRIAQHEKNIS